MAVKSTAWLEHVSDQSFYLAGPVLYIIFLPSSLSLSVSAGVNTFALLTLSECDICSL